MLSSHWLWSSSVMCPKASTTTPMTPMMIVSSMKSRGDNINFSSIIISPVYRTECSEIVQLNASTNYSNDSDDRLGNLVVTKSIFHWLYFPRYTELIASITTPMTMMMVGVTKSNVGEMLRWQNQYFSYIFASILN